jgi:hypothetical protein
MAVRLGLELRDVVADLVGEVALVFAGLDLLAGKPFDVVLIEDGRHRFDGFEIRADLLKLVAVQHLCGLGCVVKITPEDVPSGEDNIVEIGDWGEVFDKRAAAIGAFTQANVAHLGYRTNGLGETAPDGFYAGDKSGCDGSHAGNHDA